MSRPLRVLIIEDNPDDRALIQRELKREHADLRMTSILNATDFARALEEDEAYDLVLTDYQLPWTNGLATLHTIKSRYPDCPVIMVTGTGSEEIAVEAMKAGLDDYVIKAPRHCKIWGRLSVSVKTVLERAQERRALRESEDRFHAFMDNSPAVAFVKDEDGRFVYVNQVFERFFKLTRLQWLGKTGFDLWPEETARQLRENDQTILAEGKPAEFFETFPGPDGTLHHWLVFKFPVKDHAGRRLLGGMAVDITERRQLEQQLRQAQKMEAIGKLAGGVAHDVNNLVTIITGYSDMLLSRIGPEDPMRRELEQIKKDGGRAHSLTRQLLAFRRRHARIVESSFHTMERGKGLGFGLSTVYGIVKQSGGYIWVYRERGQGATSKIYLPRVVAPAESVPPVTPWSSLPQGKETVLLVEDEPEVRWLVRDMLRHLGYTVLEARHGIEAQVLSIEHPGPIHLLITDVVMPQMSGREIAEQLTSEHPETKVLYMSGYTDDAVVRHGVLAAHMAFLQKPFTPEALARKVREVLDGQTSGSGRREQRSP